MNFIKRNDDFVCLNCGRKVLPHSTSSRDHCPKCLYSLHVDIEPGDRKNDCHGILKPVGLQKKPKGWQIIYRCKKCKQQLVNLVAPDDDKEALVNLAN